MASPEERVNTADPSSNALFLSLFNKVNSCGYLSADECISPVNKRVRRILLLSFLREAKLVGLVKLLRVSE
jgi:hypothetical protein